MVSARKKKEKRKDFVKAKLKVGKSKVKANNHTDISFVAKSISLPNQSIANSNGSSVTQDKFSSATLSHYLSLFKHHSAVTRKEAILFVQLNLQKHSEVKSAGSSSINYKQVLSAVAPLLTDQSSSVRNAVLGLLKSLPEEAILSNCEILILYINSSMTSIDPAIRAKSTQALDILLDSISIRSVILRVGFIKLLSSFLSLLGWNVDDGKNADGMGKNSYLVTTSLEFGESNLSTLSTHLRSLFALLQYGLRSQVDDDIKNIRGGRYETFLIPQSSLPFLSLHLFNSSSDRNSETEGITEDFIAREKAVKSKILGIKYGIEKTQKEGGEVGRITKQLKELMTKYL